MLRTLKFASIDCCHWTCFGCTVECLIRVWLWLLWNALTCASISFSVVTALTGFRFASLQSWKEGCGFKRLLSGTQFRKFAVSGVQACCCHVKGRPNRLMQKLEPRKLGIRAHKCFKTNCFSKLCRLCCFIQYKIGAGWVIKECSLIHHSYDKKLFLLKQVLESCWFK